MKKAVLVIGFALLLLVSLLSGCTSGSSNPGSECCVLGVIGVILFIILIAYLLGGKKTVVQTQQMAPASAPIIIREESKETPKQESKPDRRCPDCGRTIPFDADLCPYCGTRFKKNYLDDDEIEEPIIDKKTEEDLTGFTVEGLYDLAYDYHYHKNDINEALLIYKEIIKDYPNTFEAKNAKTQIENIMKKSDLPKETGKAKKTHATNKNKEKREKPNIEDDALKILKLRYAKGEITKEEFEQMKKDLD